MPSLINLPLLVCFGIPFRFFGNAMKALYSLYCSYIELLKRTNLQKWLLHHLLGGWNPTQHPPCLCLCPKTPGGQYRLSDELEHDLGYTAGGSSPGSLERIRSWKKWKFVYFFFPKHATQNASWAFGEVQHLCRPTIVMNHDACVFFGKHWFNLCGWNKLVGSNRSPSHKAALLEFGGRWIP